MKKYRYKIKYIVYDVLLLVVEVAQVDMEICYEEISAASIDEAISNFDFALRKLEKLYEIVSITREGF